MKNIFRKQNTNQQKHEGPVFYPTAISMYVNMDLSPEAVRAVPLLPLEVIPPSDNYGMLAVVCTLVQNSYSFHLAYLF